jgi:hypothetical protein
MPRDVPKPDTAKERITPPANKDDCKGGGFSGFGFKNEGECVSAVESNRKY